MLAKYWAKDYRDEESRAYTGLISTSREPK
jgi:hypothetical protein